MSTDFRLFTQDMTDLDLCESSSKFDLNFDDADDYYSILRQLEPEEAITIALGIVYAVGCSYPEMTDRLRELIENNDFVRCWNRREILKQDLRRFK